MSMESWATLIKLEDPSMAYRHNALSPPLKSPFLTSNHLKTSGIKALKSQNVLQVITPTLDTQDRQRSKGRDASIKISTAAAPATHN